MQWVHATLPLRKCCAASCCYASCKQRRLDEVRLSLLWPQAAKNALHTPGELCEERGGSGQGADADGDAHEQRDERSEQTWLGGLLVEDLFFVGPLRQELLLGLLRRGRTRGAWHVVFLLPLLLRGID